MHYEVKKLNRSRNLTSETTSPADRSWGIERRLEFNETRLYWSGRFNRGNLISHFGVSVPQASQDIRRYEQLAPGNMVYVGKERAFLPTSSFKPVVLRPSADRFFAQLRALADNVIAPHEVLLGEPPDHAIVPTIHRALDTNLVHELVSAIHRRWCIDVVYQSFSSPEPRTRRLTPHALGYDGRRWHARAWCHRRKRFGDFALGRMFELSMIAKSDVDPDADTAWITEVTFVLAPNPRLSRGMRRAVACDFGMVDNRAEVTVRQALAYYLYKQLNLDRAETAEDPGEVQVVLVNPEEIEPLVRKSGTDAQQ